MAICATLKVEHKDCGLEGLVFLRPSKCQPQFAADCDISTIIKRFLRTGQLPQSVEKTEIADATDLPEDFQSMMDDNTKLTQAFEQLPLEERNKYNNDPEAWATEQIAKSDKKETSKTEDKPEVEEVMKTEDKPEVDA